MLRHSISQNIRKISHTEARKASKERRNNAVWPSVSMLRALQAAWAAGNHPPFRLLGPLMYLMHQVSGLPLLSRRALVLHGIPFCGLLGLRSEDMGLVWDVCLFVLCFYFPCLCPICDFVMLSSFSLVWFGHLCLFICMRFWLEDILSTCFRPRGRILY